MHRWKLSALAAAAFVSAALTPTDASALALGRIAVQSALGEPLRAEIDVPQVTPSELEALQAAIASPDIFKAQGMEYSNTARQVNVEVVRQADGTAKLRLTSRNPVNDPFVDLVIDANWAAGNIVRSYTLLLDPPVTPTPAPIVTSAPQIPASAPATPRASAPASAPAVAAAPSAPSTSSASSSSPDSVTVRAGDTAGRIAGAHRHAGVSLDQMLVAMLRNNPNAFINGNVNRVRAGSVIKLPSQSEAQSIPAAEARQTVAAQSRDFNEFRRRLAAKAPAAKVASAERAASGQVQAQVQDSSPSSAAADKLTLSKGAISSHANEEKLAQDKQATAQAERVDELQRNLAELQKVASATAPAVAAGTSGSTSAAEAPAAPGVTLPVTPPAPITPAADASAPAGATPSEITSLPSGSETTSADTLQPEVPAAPPVAAPVAPPRPAPAPAAPPPEPSFLEDLTGGNPLILPAAGGILALLLGLLGWKAVQRRRTLSEASTLEHTQGPDSFFGHSGGQEIDTRQGSFAPSSAAASSSTVGSSTMAYSPSQLDAGGDVDPVAEAEVYLAYGRDVQAEEILKEALRTQPERLGVHMKLAEIYAKRKDAKSLEATARTVHGLTQGSGPSWDRVVELGLATDPASALYRSGAQTGAAPAGNSGFAEALAAKTGAAAAMAADVPTLSSALDLNLDLPDSDNGPDSASIEGPSSVLTPSDQDFAALEATWSNSSPASSFSETAAAPAAEAPKPLDLGALDFALDEPLAPASKPAAPAPAVDSGVTLDLGDLNLDLGTDSISAAPAASSSSDDPLSTKLDLAREFHAIGDSEGARTLVEEVIAEASGDLKARAQRLLTEID